MLPSGRLEIGFTDVSARSGVYDVAMEGTMSINPDDNKDARADVTITARNFDRTISFMQEKAGLIPELGQGAFMAMAMKGFAKQQPDGALVWNVKVDAKGDVTINGVSASARDGVAITGEERLSIEAGERPVELVLVDAR